MVGEQGLTRAKGPARHTGVDAGILGGKMVMTSAKTGEGVEGAFNALGKAIMEAGK